MTKVIFFDIFMQFIIWKMYSSLQKKFRNYRLIGSYNYHRLLYRWL